MTEILCLTIVFVKYIIAIFRVVDPARRPSGRARAIDGLRGFLAVSVVICHGATYRAYLLGGEWGGEASHLYAACGTVPVSMFFMITGFLFWSRMVKERGRPDWGALYIGRVFRIAPLHLTAIAALLIYVAVASGGGLNVAPATLFQQVAPWAALGLIEGGDVNGYMDTSLILAGVTWSLRWEWYFYGSLVLTALAARRPGLHLPFTLAVLFASAMGTLCVQHVWSVFILLFSIGMACASARAAGYKLGAPQSILSATVLILVACCVAFLPGGYTSKSAPLLGLAFYLIAVAESTLFGALVSKAAMRLGEVSFGIYLLHGLLLASILRTDLGRFAAAASPGLYWLLVVGCLLLVLGVALLAHVAVERPGIALGRALASKLPGRSDDPSERQVARQPQPSMPAPRPVPVQF